MRKLAMSSFLALVCSTLLVAQTDEGQRPAPNYDDVTAHLGLTESQVLCLEGNKDAFRNAVAPSIEELRDLQSQLRQAARNGGDTTAIQPQIEAVRSTIQSFQTTYVSSARSCLDATQQLLLNDLVAAETLRNEVRQGIGLLLMQSTEDNGASTGFGRGRRGARRGAPKLQD